ncbi:adenine phosphoribosyltransferase [Marmoricola endophyticus]|uniref:Adenine phosphoribosyltransferase n=1 Tax=Marmoricola endophyticus TaxID=2040280 RepID=A0A917BC92_9ACTN|nr:adenine phosphoribosyltransferase [Marmoricola endophyticus]GGF36157.1 adenine phosphoribosyltransferase [Marmoricola endophyticus]
MSDFATPPDLSDALDLVRDVADFPKPGVTFKDISPLLAEPTALGRVVEALAAAGRGPDGAAAVDTVVGMESRGFIFGAPVALALGVGFVPVRKPGKLPGETRSVSYDLEYGSETLEILVDALAPGERVLLVDDVLATGGTARATADLVEQAGASVHALAVLLELSFLPGRATLGDVPLTALRTV